MKECFQNWFCNHFWLECNPWTTSRLTRRSAYFPGLGGQHKPFCPVNRPVVLASTGPSPEQRVYVYVPLLLLLEKYISSSKWSRKCWDVLRAVPPLSVTPLPLCKRTPFGKGSSHLSKWQIWVHKCLSRKCLQKERHLFLWLLVQTLGRAVGRCWKSHVPRAVPGLFQDNLRHPWCSIVLFLLLRCPNR